MKAAEWLKDLMRRHGLEPDDFTEVAKRTEEKGTPVERSTVWRISLAASKTGPKMEKLEAIAAAFGEEYRSGGKGRQVAEVVEDEQGRLAYRFYPGVNVTPDLINRLQHARTEQTDAQRDATKAEKDKGREKRRKLEEEEER
jgi:transcriptional regulator with XRE-family HTH domain